MKRTPTLLPTLWLIFAFVCLPNDNRAVPLPPDSGKSIKAGPDDPGPKKLHTIVIDPGHGGHDPGCSGANSREKHLALAIGRYFAEALQNNYPDLTVIMTRDKDVFIPLDERARIATRNKADLFISIHCNFIPKKSSIAGTETYVLGLHATEENLEVAKRENAAILYEDNYRDTYGYDPDSPEAHIIFSMFQNAYLEQSISFAAKMQRYSALEAGRRDRGVKQAGFLVLRHATMPSVLVEAGYLSNAAEENYLRAQQGQVAVANALLLAFHEYKLEYEGLLAGSVSPPTKLIPGTVTGAGSDPQLVAADDKLTPPTQPGPSAPVAQPAANKETRKPTPPPPAEPLDQKPKPASPPASIVAVYPTDTPVETAAVLEKEQPDKTNSGGADGGESVSEAAALRPMFCVQLAASPQPINVSQGKWNRLTHTVEVIREAGMYKYQIRNFSNLYDADAVRKLLRSTGFEDAFLVAYLGDKKVNPYTLK